VSSRPKSVAWRSRNHRKKRTMERDSTETRVYSLGRYAE
jgi:hypothetical protein